MLGLFQSLPPPSVATAILLLLPHFPSLPLPTRNATVQFKSITPKPLTVWHLWKQLLDNNLQQRGHWQRRDALKALGGL